MKIRIFRIVFEHPKWGTNWSARNIAGASAQIAIRKAKKNLHPSNLRVQEVKLIAEED